MTQRISALDGWRGIAILMVLLQHYGIAFLGSYWGHIDGIGQHGVTLFFVLSGFLITSKLLERQIDLPRFYVSRFFRLMPVAWCYLLLLLALQFTFRYPNPASAGWIPAVFFYRNFTGDGNLLTAHFWSLSMEEQFYFVWPVLLLMAGKNRAMWIAPALAVLCAAYRFAHWSYYERYGFFTMTQVRADAILIGCTLALLFDSPKVSRISARYALALTIPALAILLYCIAHFHRLPPLIESVSIALLIAASLLHPKRALAQVLSFPPLAWLGCVSYSLYVWQQIFVPSRTTMIPMIGVPLVAVVSHYCIERPGQRFGRWLTDRISPLVHQVDCKGARECAAPDGDFYRVDCR